MNTSADAGKPSGGRGNAENAIDTRLEILGRQDQVLRTHALERGLTLLGRSPLAHIRLSGAGISGLHVAVKRGKTHHDPLVLMDLGGPAPLKLNGERIVEAQIPAPGRYLFEIGPHKLRLVRRSVERSSLLKTPWRPVSAENDKTLTLRVRLHKRGRLVEARNSHGEFHLKEEFGVPGSHKLIWVEKNKVYAQIPPQWAAAGGRAQIGKDAIAKLEEWVAPREIKPGVIHRFHFGEMTAEIMASEGALRIGAGRLDLFPKELRRPFLASSLITFLIFLAWMALVAKPEPKVEEPYSLYARIQNIPIEKIADAPSEAQTAGGGRAAGPQPATSLTDGLKSLMGGIIGRSKAGRDAVISESGVGQALAVAGRGDAQQGKLAAVGGGAANVAGAAKLGALALAGSGKGFGGGTGTGLGAGIGAGVGSGVGKGIGGGFRLLEEESIVEGGLDKSVIAAVIQNNLSQMKYCYERQLVAEPDLFGKVVAKWDINAQGAVEGAAVKQTTLNSAPVEQCMLAKISGWKFPQPKNGSRVTVSYPFLFKSTR